MSSPSKMTRRQSTASAESSAAKKHGKLRKSATEAEDTFITAVKNMHVKEREEEEERKPVFEHKNHFDDNAEGADAQQPEGDSPAANAKAPSMLKAKPKVIRPSTYTRLPADQLPSQTLSLPYGLKFKEKVGIPLPKNLEEAASSVSKLEQEDPDAIKEYTFDLEVLLGNKKATTASPKKNEKDNAVAPLVPMSHVSSHGEGQDDAAAAAAAVSPEASIAPTASVDGDESSRNRVPVTPFDVERDGPPRFGGGSSGRPLPVAEDELELGLAGAEAATLTSKEPAVYVDPAMVAAEAEKLRKDSEQTVKEMLLGLPGGLAISTGDTEKYFGEQSRINFYDRYHYLSAQRNNSTIDNTQRSSGLVFQGRGEIFGNGVSSSDVPFAPVRPDGQGANTALRTSSTKGGAGAVAVAGGDIADAIAAGVLSDAHTRGASRSGRGGLFSAHNTATVAASMAASRGSLSALSTTTAGTNRGGTPLLPPLSMTRGSSMSMNISKDMGVTTDSIPMMNIGAGATMGGGDNVIINTGVEMSEMFAPNSTNNGNGGDVAADEAELTLDEHTIRVRRARQEAHEKRKEERRLLLLEELTMEEEEAMEMEAIAMQGMLLNAAELERKKNEDAAHEAALAAAEDDGDHDAAAAAAAAARKHSLPSVATALSVEPALNDIGGLITPMSPRSRYIDGCLRAGLNPKASLMTRKAFSKTLDLRHHGIGDKMCLILTECIEAMPYLQSLIVQDNNLTDASLGPLVQALVKMPNILEVDLSNNVVGDLASNTLSDYLADPSCPIIKLVMQSADVDDFECARFVLALQNNRSSRLQELDLTRNLLGAAEELNTVMPELVTAGEAFAELLEADTCRITKLEIGWNMIRGESAETMADALGANTSLTYLDLSYNAIGKAGGQRLGQALMDNKHLKHLNIASNNLESTACFCVSVGLIENTTIRDVILDGNPIGVLGAKALMQVPLMVGRRIKLSASNCNIAITDAGLLEKFDFENLLRAYDLDCSDPFQRAQVYMLMYTIGCHHTFIFEKVAHDGRDVSIVPFLNPDRKAHFNEKQIQMEKSLLSLIDAASDVKVAVRFFNSIDYDGSGELDRDEFKSLMDKLGIELDEDRLEDVFDTYDTDQGGTIGTDEFLVFLRRQKVDAEKRLFDLTLTPCFCLKADSPFNESLHKEDAAARKKKEYDHVPKPRKKYAVPNGGKLHIKVEDGFKRKAIFRTVTVADKESIEEVAQGTTDAVAMSSFGVMGVKLRLDEALALYNVMTMESRNKAKVLSKILPQLHMPADARLLVVKVLKNDRTEMLTLKQTLGVAIRPLLGAMNGYYQLDLSVALDRLCLMRLLEQSAARNVHLRRIKKSPLGPGTRPFDISQRKMGNSCFRNETYNGRPVHIDTAFATPLPRMGMLSFDFSGGDMPTHDDMICSDQRVVKILTTVHLMHSSPAAMDAAMSKLERLRKQHDKCMGGNGLTLYEADWERAMKIGDGMNLFYDNLSDRVSELEEVREDEDIAVNVMADDHMEFCSTIDDVDMTTKLLGTYSVILLFFLSFLVCDPSVSLSLILPLLPARIL
jgi:hypothetical protein